MTVGAVKEKKLHQHFERNPKILYVTAASAPNTKSMNDTMEVISETFRQRQNTDKDILLFGIDISGNENKSQNMYMHRIFTIVTSSGDYLLYVLRYLNIGSIFSFRVTN